MEEVVCISDSFMREGESTAGSSSVAWMCYMCLSVCVCVYDKERMRARKREAGRETYGSTLRIHVIYTRSPGLKINVRYIHALAKRVPTMLMKRITSR